MKWSRYLIRYQRKCKSHVAVIGNFGYLQKISCLVLKCGERERWDEHEPIIHIWWYISPPHLNVGSGFVWFQNFQVKSCQTSSAFCLFFFCFSFSFSFVIWSVRYAVSCLVLFMFRVVRYSLSLGRDMERNQSQNQRCETSKTTIVGKGKSEKREQSVEWWNEWGWLSICHIWKQACNITYYYGITMDIMPTF